MDRITQYARALRDFLLPLLLGFFGHPVLMTRPATPLPPPTITSPPTPLPPPTITAPPTVPAPQPNPAAATVRLQTDRGYCTATILAERPGPGRYHVLSAYHCFRGGQYTGSITLQNGRTFALKVIGVDRTADLALCEIQAPDGLPGAWIADSEPMPGTAVWHQGYGRQRPGNRETGHVVRGPQPDGQIILRLSVSSGDSGAGVFRADNGQLVSVICCTSGAQTRGAGVTAIRQLLQAMSDPCPAGGADCPHGIRTEMR